MAWKQIKTTMTYNVSTCWYIAGTCCNTRSVFQSHTKDCLAQFSLYARHATGIDREAIFKLFSTKDGNETVVPTAAVTSTCWGTTCEFVHHEALALVKYLYVGQLLVYLVVQRFIHGVVVFDPPHEVLHGLVLVHPRVVRAAHLHFLSRGTTDLVKMKIKLKATSKSRFVNQYFYIPDKDPWKPNHPYWWPSSIISNRLTFSLKLKIIHKCSLPL